MQKSGLETNAPKSYQKHPPKRQKRGAKGRQEGTLGAPKCWLWHPIHCTSVAWPQVCCASAGGKGWGGSTTCPRLADDLPTTCRRLADENIRGPNSPPGPSLETAEDRTRSWKDSTTRTEKEGKHEGKVISHTPYTLLRRVGGYRTHEGRQRRIVKRISFRKIVWKTCKDS